MELINALENLARSSSDSFAESIQHVDDLIEGQDKPATLITDLDGVFNNDQMLTDYPLLRVYAYRWLARLHHAIDPSSPDEVKILQLNSQDDFSRLQRGQVGTHTIMTGAGKNLKERMMMHSARLLFGKDLPGGSNIRRDMLTETVSAIVSNCDDNIIVLDGENDMYPAFNYAAEHYNHRSFSYVSIESAERKRREMALKVAVIGGASLLLYKMSSRLIRSHYYSGADS